MKRKEKKRKEKKRKEKKRKERKKKILVPIPLKYSYSIEALPFSWNKPI